MASSPLRRPLSRASSRSSSSTQYEIDVDALFEEKDDDSILVDQFMPKNDAKDKIFSDDIDGPTDFTQNLEFWMRGGQWPKNKMKAESRAVQTMQSLQVDTVQEHQLNNAEKSKAVETAEIQKTSTAQLHSEHLAHKIALESPSRFDQENSELHGLPKLNVQGPGSQSDSEDDSTPVTQPKPSLQPSVEDYNSTPIRPRTTRSVSSSALGDTLRRSIAKRFKGAQAQNLQQQHSVEDITITLQKTINALREELWKCKADASAERNRLISDFERRREDYQRDVDNGAKEKDALIARLNHELSQQRQETQILRTQNGSLQSQLQGQLMKNDGLRQTLNYQVSASKRKSDAESLSAKRQMEELRKQHQLELDRQRTSYESRLLSLTLPIAPPSQTLPTLPSHLPNAHLESQITTLQSHLTAANTTISTLRAEIATSQQAIHVLQSQVAQEKQSAMVLNQQGQTTTTHINALREEVAEIRSQLLSTEIERDLAETAREDLEERCEGLEARVKDLSIAAVGESTNARVAELLTKMGQLQAEKALLEERVDELEEQIVESEERINELEGERDGMRATYEDRITAGEVACRKLVEELKSARMALKERDILKASLTTCEALLQQHKIDLETAKADALRASEEVETLKKEFEDVNQVMDKKVKEMMDQRDAEWIKKVEGLDRERKIMGRVLLSEWGKGEFGRMEPQAYRYRYAVRQEV